MQNLNIHPTAIVSNNAQVPNSVKVGPFSIIHDNVFIGEDSNIGSYCEIGIKNAVNSDQELRIGSNALIRSHTVMYSGSSFANFLETGHHVSLRERIQAGENLRVGSYSDLQGDIELGQYVRLHSNVHLGKQTKIGNFVWIFPFVVTTNDPTPPSNVVKGCSIHDFAVIATGSILIPGVTVGENSLVGANSTVNRNVAPFSVVVGNPAKHIKDVRDVLLPDGSGVKAYPWNKNFSRGFPDDVIEGWKNSTINSED
jgi:acyl-[acyl carrier protein]--UDP-N-acetylglucosamine O-acyltransferase